MLQPYQSAGVLPQTNWNMIDIRGGGDNVALCQGTYGNLEDATARTTPVALEYIGNDAWNTGGSTSTPDYKLMQGILKHDITGSATISLTFSSLAEGPYDVYVYGAVDGGPVRLTATIGLVTYYWREPASFDGTFTLSASTTPTTYALGDCVKFTDLAPVNGAIHIDATYHSGGGGLGGPEIGISGLQLVSKSRKLLVTQSGGSLILSWRQGILLQAPSLSGPWTTNPAASPCLVTPSSPEIFYRVLMP
jgi:hypothetical protein